MSVLYEHPSPLSLLPLLRRHLPHSLPAVSTLLTPGKPSKVYTTFPPAELVSFEQAGDEPWVVLIDSGNQYRFYCNSSSPESGAAQNDSGATEQDQASGRLLEKVIKEMMERASREKAEVVRIGAIPDRWIASVEKITGVERTLAYRLWCDPSWYGEKATPETVRSEESIVNAPDGFEFREATEEDIPIILSTSDVPHLPSYLSTRLPYTSCLFSLRPPSSSTSSPESTTEVPHPRLVAHATTHRDGSLGTLYVNPSFRRQGLARLVLQHRISKMRQGVEEKVGFCYVHHENESSRAVMKSLGWRESEENVMWDIVDVKEWERGREMRN